MIFPSWGAKSAWGNRRKQVGPPWATAKKGEARLFKKRFGLAALLLSAVLTGEAASGEGVVRIVDVVELSGGGATVGTNWRNGVELAAKEINAGGGILGRKIVLRHFDTQSNPGVSKAVLMKALDTDPYVVLGPIYSSSTKVNMIVTQRAKVPQIVGSEAAEITERGNPYIFRTSFGQASSMPKLANYLRDGIKAKSVALIWVNNAFGKGGHDAVVKELKKRGIRLAADISSEVQQVDFAADVIRIKNSGADALFAYLHEEESARLLVELRKQGYAKPVVGESTLLSAKVIKLAGKAANGATGHVGLSPDAPVPGIRRMAKAFEAAYGYATDHNGIKGYIAMYVVKAVTEKIGKFDRQAFAKTLRGLTITPETEPGVLLETTYDDKGNLDRDSFLVEIVDGKQKITRVLPKLGK